jgi:hypothetical protein
MRLFELEQPSVGDILEIELGDEIVEAVITAIEDGEIIAETDNRQGARLLTESYGRYYCSTDKKWKERKGPKQSRKVAEARVAVPPENNTEAAKKFLQYVRRNIVDLASMMSFYEENYNKPYYEKKFDNFFKSANGQPVKVVFDDGADIELSQNVLHIPIGKYYQYRGFLSGPTFVNDILAALGTPVAAQQGVSEAHPNSKIYDKCWDGYKKVPGKKRGQAGSCVKEDELNEAEYQGREVKLSKPMQGDVKKFKVYVKDPNTGNVKKVNFGDPNMRIKKSNPKRRKSFRARHNCSNPGPKTKARYWSCRKW